MSAALEPWRVARLDEALEHLARARRRCERCGALVDMDLGERDGAAEVLCQTCAALEWRADPPHVDEYSDPVFDVVARSL